MSWPADWLQPDWPAPPGVRAVCTTRAGGVSQAPYASMNLGDHVGDDPAAVAANRRSLARALQVQPVFLQQVHGWEVAALSAPADASVQGDAPQQADGCVASGRGVACTIMVADCLPVLFTDVEGRAVAAAHAGWRGLAGVAGSGVLERTVAALRSALQADTGNTPTLMAWLGPCIGPAAFEVGDEVKSAFETHDPRAAELFEPHAAGKWLADLPGLARRRLQALGLTQIHGNDGSAAWCTASNPSRFFSHRRDRIGGRFAACIWKD